MNYTIEIARDTKDPKVLTDIFFWYADEVSYFDDCVSEYATEVSHYAVLNPNCPPKILTEILKKGKDDYISIYAARNLNCPKEILVEILRRGKDDSVSYSASQNPNCPPEMLVEILRRGKNDDISWNAVENPNCPKDILIEVLRRGKIDNISCTASRNSNCPIEARIKWMQETGQIEKEDPNKHIIEYENIKQDDFQDLKELL